jgi:hypothetical protein
MRDQLLGGSDSGGHSGYVELLHYTLPPTFCDLKLIELPFSDGGDDLSPERPCCNVLLHLAYFPRPRMTAEHMSRKLQAHSEPSIVSAPIEF